MSIDLYYFSGTGNTLKAARELQKQVPEINLIPIIHCLKGNKIRATSDTVGFAFPNFCMLIPIPVHDFLHKIELVSATYLFALCTRGGSRSQAFDFINKILKRQGKKLNCQININMPWNYPIGKEDFPNTINKRESEYFRRELKNKINKLSSTIINRKRLVEPDTDVKLHTPLLIDILSILTTKEFNYKSHVYMYQKKIHFYSDSRCNGCGECEKVCLSNKIKMQNNVPVWINEIKCLACFACINYCPKQAIQVESRFPVKSYSQQNGRYHNEDINVNDIAEQC